MIKLAPIVLLAAALSACATTPHADPAGEPLEAVYSVSAEKTALAVRVSSNGCTKAEDFAVKLTRGAEGAVVTLRRIRQDPCRAFVIGGTVVKFDYGAIGVTGELRLANPLTPWNGPGD